MAPLILHNVPDDECYVGDDGVKRPYAMIFSQHDGPSGSTRSRRSVAESGAFGKSTRRSRSRTSTPGRARENPTLAAADKVFSEWVSSQSVAPPQPTGMQRKGQTMMQDDSATSRLAKQSSPVELMLRGYRSSTQQYAAIAQYEALAGPILEDYPRDAPASQRRYKSDLRDPAFIRRRNLNASERVIVNRADGGEHWVKVTFETATAANAALAASPQSVLGYLVFAEPYRGLPPAKDEPCPDTELTEDGCGHPNPSLRLASGTSRKGNTGGSMPSSFRSRLLEMSPPNSRRCSLAADAAASPSSRAIPSTSTMEQADPDAARIPAEADSIFCQRIPTARRAVVLPADQALLPQPSYAQRVLQSIPLVKWFSGSMIGNEVPRTETGDFDWTRASLYWKIIWWLDATFGLFKGDISGTEKDD